QVVVAMQAALRLGAAYVPVDPTSPVSRAKTVLRDCGVKALVARADSAALVLTEELEGVPFVVASGGAEWREVSAQSSAPLERPAVGPDDLAYILYTSGS